jgi:hypothetical protein
VSDSPPPEDPGPLVRRLLAEGWLTAASPLSADPLLAHEVARVFGRRGVYKPAVALRTIQRLGNARHALAQRTVAGCMEVHAPFAPKRPDPAGKDVGKLGKGSSGSSRGR